MIRQVAIVPTGHHPCGHTAQIFDQSKAQHDGNSPQFAQAQRSDGLIGGDEAPETFTVDPSISVGDGFQGDVINAGQGGRWPMGQPG